MGAVPELVRLRLATADKGRAALKSTRGISESPNVSMSKLPTTMKSIAHRYLDYPTNCHEKRNHYLPSR
jgi:hypothetical protein